MENQQANHNKILLVISVVLIFFSGYICDYIYPEGGTEAWRLMLNLYRLSFLLIFFTIKSKLKNITIALLINHFIDEFLKIEGWSINDTITVIYIALITLKKYIKK